MGTRAKYPQHTHTIHTVKLGDQFVLELGEGKPLAQVVVGNIVDVDGYVLVGIQGPGDNGHWDDDPEAPYQEIYCRVVLP